MFVLLPEHTLIFQVSRHLKDVIIISEDYNVKIGTRLAKVSLEDGLDQKDCFHAAWATSLQRAILT